MEMSQANVSSDERWRGDNEEELGVLGSVIELQMVPETQQERSQTDADAKRPSRQYCPYFVRYPEL